VCLLQRTLAIALFNVSFNAVLLYDRIPNHSLHGMSIVMAFTSIMFQLKLLLANCIFHQFINRKVLSISVSVRTENEIYQNSLGLNSIKCRAVSLRWMIFPMIEAARGTPGRDADSH